MRQRQPTLREALVRSAGTNRGSGYGSSRWQVVPRRRRVVSRAVGAMQPAPLDQPGVRTLKLSRVEAVLFAAGEPLTTRRIADAANLTDSAEARVLLQQLKRAYDAELSAFTVETIAGGWHLCTRPQFAPWLEKLHPSRHQTRLSQPALETLAVVAYRQPILRADVESIRGVSCGEMLRQLIDRGLVRIVGHHDSLGRPLLYGTTRKFLEVFGLADLSNLPLAEQLRQPAHARVVAPSSAPDPGGSLEKNS